MFRIWKYYFYQYYKFIFYTRILQCLEYYLSPITLSYAYLKWTKITCMGKLYSMRLSLTCFSINIWSNTDLLLLNSHFYWFFLFSATLFNLHCYYYDFTINVASLIFTYAFSPFLCTDLFLLNPHCYWPIHFSASSFNLYCEYYNFIDNVASVIFTYTCFSFFVYWEYQ